jgi:hypothetical protein
VYADWNFSRLPTNVDANKTRTAVNLPVFGFIDCTLKGARRVKYGQAAIIYSGHQKSMDLSIILLPSRMG